MGVSYSLLSSSNEPSRKPSYETTFSIAFISFMNFYERKRAMTRSSLVLLTILLSNRFNKMLQNPCSQSPYRVLFVIIKPFLNHP